VRLVQAASALGDSRDAESSYRKTLDLQPNDPAAIAGLAGLYGRTNRMAEAMKLAEELKRSNPKSGVP
jgi:Flp pilus assembly protein TadD